PTCRSSTSACSGCCRCRPDRASRWPSGSASWSRSTSWSAASGSCSHGRAARSRRRAGSSMPSPAPRSWCWPSRASRGATCSNTGVTEPMDDAHLKEEATASELLFEGHFLRAKRDTVRLPDGHSGTREYVEHPGAVVVVPLLDDGRLVLERQYRYSGGHVMTQFPAGA